ncbi:hypothetical protein AB0G97_08860 [Streptomyces sp. NPDC020755]|uniref:hypothetical protein n=1 Tax=Streptomyces sp. NPDC020755 TaxID=3154790 RepID=UPI0033E4D0E2
MAQNSWPSPSYNTRAVTDAEYEQLSARFSDDGVYGDPTDSPVATAGTGLTVNIRANVAASVRGHAWTSGTTGDTLNIAPNPAGSARTDRVVLRLDRSTWTVRAVIRQGTPGAAAPPLARDTGGTGLWEILLAGVVVPAGANAVTVIRGELYVGSRVRPALASHVNPYPETGEMAWATDTQELRLWNGSRWITTYSDSGPIVVNAWPQGWAIDTDSVLEARSGIVQLRLGSFTRLGSTLPADTNSRLPVIIPAQWRHPVRDQYLICYITGAYIGRITIKSAASSEPGQVWLTQKPDITQGRKVLTSGASWIVG